MLLLFFSFAAYFSTPFPIGAIRRFDSMTISEVADDVHDCGDKAAMASHSSTLSVRHTVQQFTTY